ncbi:MAG: hypothetical protein JXR37_14050, partial [Kiritimatiellae bacterium]|nr:hypothetical protein [Kiritimatiellia bacterium]
SGTTLPKILGAVAAPRIFSESGGGMPGGAGLVHAGVHDGVSTLINPAHPHPVSNFQFRVSCAGGATETSPSSIENLLENPRRSGGIDKDYDKVSTLNNPAQPRAPGASLA